MDLLQKLKFSRGIIKADDSLDDYYKEAIMSAIAELSSDNVSESVLNSLYGRRAIIYCAGLIMDKKDRATDPTLILMKNTLSNMTDGERCEDAQW